MSTNAGYWARQIPVYTNPFQSSSCSFHPIVAGQLECHRLAGGDPSSSCLKRLTDCQPFIKHLRTRRQRAVGYPWRRLLFSSPFVSSAFDPRRSLSLILTYVRATHKSDRRIETRYFGIFSRFRARGKSGKLWAWKFRSFKMSQELLCFGMMNNID